jgi:hypothetical protein
VDADAPAIAPLGSYVHSSIGGALAQDRYCTRSTSGAEHMRRGAAGWTGRD